MALANIQSLAMAANPVITIISKAMSLFNKLVTARKNKRNFELLANQIKSLTAILESLSTQGAPLQGVVWTGVREFSSALDSAEELHEKYVTSSKVDRFFKASSLRDKFKRVYKQLKTAERYLNLALSVERRSGVYGGNTGMDLVPWQGGAGGRGAGVMYPSGYASAAVSPYQSGYATGGGTVSFSVLEVVTPYGMLAASQLVITNDDDDDFNSLFFFE